MLAKIHSYGIHGLDAYPVVIEVDTAKGLPATIIVGLPDNAVKESKERVRSAINNGGYKFSPQRITINLSPADMKKEGPSFDLAIAVGILMASGQIPYLDLSQYVILGELSLDGRIQPVHGALPIALSIAQSHLKGLLIPAANAAEASVANHIPVYGFQTLKELIQFLSDPSCRRPFVNRAAHGASKISSFEMDFSDVKGQTHAKRGLEIAAAGRHNVLLIGPPGSGKSMLAKRLPTILPDMTWQETLETTKIHSVMGLIAPGQSLVAARPFRSPHHTTSDAAIVGGGSHPKAGEVTLSHNGILFLDELPEFNRNVLEALRQPLEDQCVTIARAVKSVRFPAKFMLVCAMNPCPCGWYTDPKRVCHCAPLQIQRYLSKISGPLLDRIDIHLDVPALKPNELLSQGPGESSQDIKTRTMSAHAIQAGRFKDTDIFANAQMNHRQIKKFCGLNDECKRLLKMAIEELNLSARAYDKILKVARTIADLGGSESILSEHLAEAIQYRCLDRTWWG